MEAAREKGRGGDGEGRAAADGAAVAELRCASGASSNTATHAILPAEVALVRDLLRLVPAGSLQEACSTHGIASTDVVAKTNTLISKIECQAQAAAAHGLMESEQPGRGHRPVGVASVVDDMAAQGRAMLEMDDEILDDLAEAAVGHADPDDGSSRTELVAAAKARLKSKRGDLAKKLVVKRIGK